MRVLAAIVLALALPAAALADPRTVKPDRPAIDRLLDEFIPAAVAQKNLQRGWELSAGVARTVSHAEWMQGNTSVQKYPAKGTRFRGWTVNYSYPGDVGFDIFVAPRNPKDVSMAFRGEAKKIAGKWKIAVFYPQATFQPAGKKAYVWADTDLQPQAVGSSATSGRLSAAWLLFPAGIVGAALVGGIGFAVARGLRRRARVKRIERDLALMR